MARAGALVATNISDVFRFPLLQHGAAGLVDKRLRLPICKRFIGNEMIMVGPLYGESSWEEGGGKDGTQQIWRT